MIKVIKKYIVLSRQDIVGRTGKPYINIKIANKEENLNILVWDVEKEENPTIGHIISFNVPFRDYQGKKSVNKEDMNVSHIATEEDELYSLIPRPTKKEDWDKTFENLLTKCTDEKLIGVIKEYSEKLYPLYCKYPAATTVHHAYPGGLTTHTWQMLHMLEGIYPCYPYPDDIKIERCIIGILFHDWGKTVEYETDGEPTKYMYLLGHIYMSAQMVNAVLKKAGIDDNEARPIVHCVLAHHGELEYGSPVMPCIPEAQLIHYLDNISAKADMFDTTGNMEKNFALGTHVVK